MHEQKEILNAITYLSANDVQYICFKIHRNVTSAMLHFHFINCCCTLPTDASYYTNLQQNNTMRVALVVLFIICQTTSQCVSFIHMQTHVSQQSLKLLSVHTYAQQHQQQDAHLIVISQKTCGRVCRWHLLSGCWWLWSIAAATRFVVVLYANPARTAFTFYHPQAIFE